MALGGGTVEMPGYANPPLTYLPLLREGNCWLPPEGGTWMAAGDRENIETLQLLMGSVVSPS